MVYIYNVKCEFSLVWFMVTRATGLNWNCWMSAGVTDTVNGWCVLTYIASAAPRLSVRHGALVTDI